jgi:methionyl-tRNA formyltransferase
MSFDQIMKPSLFSIPKFGSINCHAGKLPFYRGRNVLNWVLINDEKEFGITVHFIDEGIDTGDIILQKVYPISDRDTYQTLLDKSFKECGIILHQAITNIQQGTFSRINQKDLHPVGSYCIQRLPGDEIIDWNQTTRSIFCFVRALSHPGPSATTFFKNSSVKIHRTEQVDSAQDYLGIPGSIVAVSAENFTVKTSDNLIRVTDWSGMSNPQVGWRFG